MDARSAATTRPGGRSDRASASIGEIGRSRGDALVVRSGARRASPSPACASRKSFSGSLRAGARREGISLEPIYWPEDAGCDVCREANRCRCLIAPRACSWSRTTWRLAGIVVRHLRARGYDARVDGRRPRTLRSCFARASDPPSCCSTSTCRASRAGACSAAASWPRGLTARLRRQRHADPVGAPPRVRRWRATCPSRSPCRRSWRSSSAARPSRADGTARPPTGGTSMLFDLAMLAFVGVAALLLLRLPVAARELAR